MRISDWSSDVCSSDLRIRRRASGNGEGSHAKYAGEDVIRLCGVPHRRRAADIDVGGIGNGDDEFGNLRTAKRRCLRTEGVGGDLLRVGGGFVHHRPRHRRKRGGVRSEEHTSELQSLMRISYAVFCLKKTIK